MPYGVVSAKMNNVAVGLYTRVFHNVDVEFLDICSSSGMRTYTRSLCFVLAKAVEELFPKGEILMQHPVSRGYYCSLRIGRKVTLEDVSAIRSRMREIVREDIPFKRTECRSADAVALFRRKGMDDKARLLETTGDLYTFYYTLGDTVDFYYGSLLPSTGFIQLFDIVKYYDGILLRVPRRDNPTQLEEIVKQEKMFDVFDEQLQWQEVMDLYTVGDCNYAVQHNLATELIHVGEALQEKKIARIADDIAGRGKVKMVLISGPSSSGKTTFSKRLSIQLITNGMKPYSISLDDYFVDREKTPKDANGDYDYESLYALNLPLFNAQLAALLRGEEVELPRYNFATGQSEKSGRRLKIDDNMVLILEGIHALNPELTPQIPDENKYRVYVSALTTIHLDHHNYIPTTDNRLLRRITRDYKYRNCSAENTINRWHSVRAGEDKWIFPYQENADAMFNSALIFELAVLKAHVEPLLAQVPQNSPAFSEAFRLRCFLHYFTGINGRDIPSTSLLREFVGGSSFTY